ncbi:hypothetical protein [Legionella oakridgensis]|uniref:Polysaccharide deacetylase n=2 Tax=Legionella oakridgensis TaxID=29423 RepID=W0B536_9GAMM|nr:hypothetical protein [Legionella oakridgensis]AHE65638.1 hypothetical protein Loa_00047 [Legionella oakridgensis ATCC 33761 = DSM 21215]KTD38274.1 hypothetical protein Loak_1950 [Legionella oakridgensis]STY15594.1 Uncharacterised protein [Legionella longbeachae]
MSAVFQRHRIKPFSYVEIIKSIHAEYFIYGEESVPNKGIWMRHDEDWDLNYSLKMAKLEKQLGIRATYFINHTTDYFDYSDKLLGACKEIIDCGHFIGLHNNAIEQYFKTNEPIKAILEKPLSFLRDNNIPVNGVSSHGSSFCNKNGWLNCEIWSEFNNSDLKHLKNTKQYNGNLPFDQVSLSDFDLKYEASFAENNAYISDSSGRLWGFYKNQIPEQNRLYDIIEYAEIVRAKSVIKNNINEIIYHFNQYIDYGFMQILFHPKWWISE